MEDDSSYVIHQFIDRYDDASHKRSKQRKKIDTLQVSKLPTRRKRKVSINIFLADAKSYHCSG